MYIFLRRQNTSFSSFLGALFFTFSPIAFGRALGHLDLLSYFIFPLAYLALEAIKRKQTSIVVLSIIMLISYSITPIYFFLLSLSLMFYSFLWSILDFKKKLSLFVIVVSSFIITIIVLIPVVKDYIIGIKNGSYFLLGKDWIGYHDLLSILVPNEFSLLGFFTKETFIRILEIDNPLNSSHRLPITLIVLICFLSLQLKLKTGIPPKLRNKLIVWFLLFLTFLLLNAGRYIKFFSIKLESPLFYLVNYFFPLMRSYSFSYFLTVALFAAVVIFTTMFDLYLKRFNKKRKIIITLFVSSLFLVLEGIPISYPLYKIDFSFINFLSSYKNYLGNDTTILNIPIHYSKNAFFQTYHEKPILDGYPSRINLNSLQILNQIDLYIYENRIEDLRTLFQNYRVKFILISWKAYVEVPKILHFKTLTKPEVFYNITGNILEPLYQSSSISMFIVK
jgi:hypothetical protein